MNISNLKKRKINVIVDNPSWVMPYANEIANFVNKKGNDECFYFDRYDAVTEADISLYLGCITITPETVLKKSKKNLVVHASNLPIGRGFSPLSWQILEGKSEIPVCLFEMTSGVDEGPIVYQEKIILNGHELLPELRYSLGNKIVSLCLKYINSTNLPKATPQNGEPTYYKRRHPSDSKIDFTNTIQEVFNLFRIADNDRYPVYFENEGFKYILKIEKEQK